MGMGADFDDDDYANEYDDDEEEGRRQVVQDWHQLVTCISDKVKSTIRSSEENRNWTEPSRCSAVPRRTIRSTSEKPESARQLWFMVSPNSSTKTRFLNASGGPHLRHGYGTDACRCPISRRLRETHQDGDGGAVKENNTIIYIDEIHNMIGAGRGSDGGPDASNMLKQYLEAGDIRFIGSTTYEEYNRYMAQSKGIVRRFQQIDIKEPTEEEAIKILEGLRYKYNKFHNVTYRKDALEYAVRASAKYISNRCLPDKGHRPDG